MGTQDNRLAQRKKQADKRIAIEKVLDPYDTKKIRKDLENKRKELNRSEQMIANAAAAQFKRDQKPGGVYKPGYDIKDFDSISFKDYMNMRDSAQNGSGFLGNALGLNTRVRDNLKYIQDNGMVKFSPETDQAYIDGKINELFPERAFGLDYAKGQYVSGDQSTNGKVEYVDMGGDKRVINNSAIPTNVATGQTFSGDGGNASGVVVDKKVVTPQAPVMPNIDLNQIARNDHSVGIADIPKVALKPELRNNEYGYHMKDGTNFWTVNNDDSYWDNRVMGTGNAWSHADTKQPKKELDTKAIGNFFSSLFN